MLITAKIDVGSNPVWSIPTTVSVLDSLYANQLINKVQYLERIPNGLIPDKTSLLREAREEAKLIQQQAMMQQTVPTATPEGDIPPDSIPIMEGDI